MYRPLAAQWPGHRLRGRQELDWDIQLRPGLRAGDPGPAQVQGRSVEWPRAPRLHRSASHTVSRSLYQELITLTHVKRTTGVTIIPEPGYRSHAAQSWRKWAPHISCLPGMWNRLLNFYLAYQQCKFFLCHTVIIAMLDTDKQMYFPNYRAQMNSRQRIGKYYLSHLIIILSTIRLNFSLLLWLWSNDKDQTRSHWQANDSTDDDVQDVNIFLFEKIRSLAQPGRC